MINVSKKVSVGALVFFILSALLAGAVGALLGGELSTASLNAPPLAPPGWLFVPVWSVLYILMGIAAYLVLKSGDIDRGNALKWYAVQLAVNVLWTLFFFNLEWRLFSFFWILLLIALVAHTIEAFCRHSPTAGRLLIPYLVWLLFAAYLNLGYYVRNR